MKTLAALRRLSLVLSSTALLTLSVVGCDNDELVDRSGEEADSDGESCEHLPPPKPGDGMPGDGMPGD
ncbi:MAG: hypothetical protein KC486_30265, partial [Myxococcales bacterium]|nr:hypothetical protein [Myxococcales bacterium]